MIGPAAALDGFSDTQAGIQTRPDIANSEGCVIIHDDVDPDRRLTVSVFPVLHTESNRPQSLKWIVLAQVP